MQAWIEPLTASGSEHRVRVGHRILRELSPEKMIPRDEKAMVRGRRSARAAYHPGCRSCFAAVAAPFPSRSSGAVPYCASIADPACPDALRRRCNRTHVYGPLFPPDVEDFAHLPCPGRSNESEPGLARSACGRAPEWLSGLQGCFPAAHGRNHDALYPRQP